MTGKRQRKKEKADIERLGAKPTVNSGSTHRTANGTKKRHDALPLIIEHKSTGKKSMSVKREWLEKTIRQAQERGAIPAWQLDIGGIMIVAMLEEDW